METETPNEDKQQISLSDSDWDNRILCSDGNCIGVIGPDGKCKECGQAYEGILPENRDSDPDPVSRPEGDDESSAGADAEEQPSSSTAAEPAEEIESDDWSQRKLCLDGNCIGVIGPDGRCKECGKPSK